MPGGPFFNCYPGPFSNVRCTVSLKVEDVKADSVAITYNGGFGIDMIIAGTLSFLKAKVPELANAIISEEGHLSELNYQNYLKRLSLWRLSH